MTLYHPREVSHQLAEALTALPVVVLTGLRQAGKTTFLRNDPAVRDRRFFTLDDLAVLEAARRDPDALVAGEEPVTIDEAQRCPALVLAVKRAVDRRRRPGQVILSGSANFALLQAISETLAGRAVYVCLHPFTRREHGQRTADTPFLVRFLDQCILPPRSEGRPLCADEVLDGGLPPVVLGETTQRGLWFSGYEQTYLERDVRELAQVADLVTYRQFLQLCALRTAQVLNQSALARDARLTSATAGRYLGLLETSYVVRRLPPFLRSRAARLIKSPKLFLSDAGLAAHLAGVPALGPEADEPLRGALFETYVVQNLAAILDAHLPAWELSFWHVQGRHEVDCVLSTPRSVVAIEVKAATSFSSADLSGLRALAERVRGVRALVLAYNGMEAVALGEQMFAIPLGLLLS